MMIGGFACNLLNIGGLYVALAIIQLTAGFAIIGINVCFYYSLFKGIKEISQKLGEEKFADKIENFWYTFVWTWIFTIVTGFSILIIFEEIIATLTVIFLLICLIVSIVFFIYIYKAYKLLNGREIPSESSSYNEKESEDAKLE